MRDLSFIRGKGGGGGGGLVPMGGRVIKFHVAKREVSPKISAGLWGGPYHVLSKLLFT